MLALISLETNTTKVKKMNGGLFIQINIEATKISSDWYLWITHLLDNLPNNKEEKYTWQKSI